MIFIFDMHVLLLFDFRSVEIEFGHGLSTLCQVQIKWSPEGVLYIHIWIKKKRKKKSVKKGPISIALDRQKKNGAIFSDINISNHRYQAISQSIIFICLVSFSWHVIWASFISCNTMYVHEIPLSSLTLAMLMHYQTENGIRPHFWHLIKWTNF